MARQRLNKNLIGGLTVVGMILSVVVVGVAVINAAAKDPVQIATKAEEAEKAGDLQRARDLYVKAFDVKKESKYLVEAARVSFVRGELADMFQRLHQAAAQSPDDPVIAERLLERYWDLRNAGYAQWKPMLERAEELLKLQPNNLLALVAKAESLQALVNEDAQNADRARDALATAVKLGPDDPRVALNQAREVLRRGFERAAAAMRAGRASDGERLIEEGRQEAVAVAEAALKANPTAGEVRALLAEAVGAGGDRDAARKLLQEGVALNGDDPALRTALARYDLAMAREKLGAELEQASPEARSAATELLRDGLQQIQAAVKTEPAMYEAYPLEAVLKQLSFILDGRWKSDRIACVKDILDGMMRPLDSTLTLKSFRAQFGQPARAEMIGLSFESAFDYYRNAIGPDDRTVALDYMRRLAQLAQDRYPNTVLEDVLLGQLAIIDRDTDAAIARFEAAEKKSGQNLPLMTRMARERLTALYRDRGAQGLALQYANLAIQSYESMQQQPARAVLVVRVQLLIELNRAAEALDAADTALMIYPDDNELLRAKAGALALLDRPEEAQRVLAQSGGEGPAAVQAKPDWDNKFAAARIAAYSGDYAQAETLLRELIAALPNNTQVVELLARVMMAAERNAEADGVLSEAREKATSDDAKRLIDAYLVMVREADPEVRARKLLEIISAIPDLYARHAELFNYYSRRNDLAKAGNEADELEKLKPDDVLVLKLQFDLAMRGQNYDRADGYARKLSDLNADRVHGWTFKGQLKLARGDAVGALADFRTAERDRPTDPDLKVLIGQALLGLNPPRYDDAVAALRQGLDFAPKSFAANRLLFYVFEQRGRPEEGRPYLEAAAKVEPDDPYVAERMRWFNEEADPKSGIDAREKLLADEPDNLDNALRLARLYARQGEMAKAAELLEQLFARDRANLRVVQSVIEFQVEQKDRAAVDATMRQYLDASKGAERIEGYRMLARAYEMLGDRAASLETLAQADRQCDETLTGDAKQMRLSKATVAADQHDVYRRADDLPAAVDAIRRVLSLLSEDQIEARQTFRLELVRMLYTIRQYAEAETEIASYRKDYPEDVRGMVVEAEVLARRGGIDRLKRSEELLGQALATNPSDPWAYYLRGSLRIELHRYVEASDDLTKAKTLAPSAFNLGHRLELARLYELMERYPLAETELRELIKLQPDNAAVAVRLMSTLRNSGKKDAVLAFVNERIAADPANAFWPYQLGQLFMQQQNYSAAVQPLQTAVELSQGRSPSLVADWMFALNHAKRPLETIAAFEKMSPEEKIAIIRVNAAEGYSQAGQTEAAEEQFGVALESAAKENVDAVRYVFGRLVGELGDAKAAALSAKISERMKDDLAAAQRIQIIQARFDVESGDAQRITRALETAQSLIASLPPTDRTHIEALLCVARARDAQGDPEGSAKAYEALLQIIPNNAAALNNLAFLLADRLNRPADAEPYATRARDVAPANANIQDTLGWIFYLNGNLVQAETTLLEALRLDPDNLISRWHLAQVYIKLPRVGDARKTLEKLRDLAREQKNAEYVDKATADLQKLPS